MVSQYSGFAPERMVDDWLWSAVELRKPTIPRPVQEVLQPTQSLDQMSEPPGVPQSSAEPLESTEGCEAAERSLMSAAPVNLPMAEALADFDLEQAEPVAEWPIATSSKIEEAVELHRLGRWEQALALYSLIPASDPSYADALINMIAIAAARRDSSKLHDYGQELLNLRRHSVPALQALIQSAMATGDYKAAAQHGIRLVKQTPDSHQAWFNLGLCYHEQNHYEEASQAYTEAIKVRPDAIRAHANLGVLLQRHGDLTGARREFEHVLDIEPNNLPTLWNLALVHEKEAHTGKAEKIYLRLIREEYQVYAVAFRLGQLRLNRKNYIGAREAFELCLVERAGDAEAQTNLLLTQIRCRDLDVSTASPTHKTISDLLGSHPDSQEGLLLQATLAIAENDWRTATPLEAKLNQMGENTGILAYNIGVLQQKENLLAEAIDSYDRACGQRPCFAEAHLNRGHALMQIGETERARADWVDALEAKPELANSYFKDVAISELPTGVA